MLDDHVEVFFQMNEEEVGSKDLSNLDEWAKAFYIQKRTE